MCLHRILRSYNRNQYNRGNNFRPHEALNYQTPRAYFEELKSRNLATKDVIVLQA